MASQTFSVTTQFGVTNGPVYVGTTSVAPVADGDNVTLYALTNLAGGSGTVTLDPNALVSTGRFGGLGFQCVLSSLNGNAGTPAAVIKLKAAGVGAADISITLSPGQTVAFTAAAQIPLTAAWTSITVDADATSDLQIFGILNTQAA